MSSKEHHPLFDLYLAYTEETESPVIYHRWCLISAIGALLGRKYYLQHGRFRVFPNLYCMLIGHPGTRKSSAVKGVKKLILSGGYDTIAANRTSKEKFLLDLEGGADNEAFQGSGGKAVYDSVTANNLWGPDSNMQEPREVFVMADEFNEFIGLGNIEFCSLLGDLWDWDDEKTPYKQRLKNSKSVEIYQPTISILGGNTPENFAAAFPPTIMGQGFLSRLLLIHGEMTGKQYAFPPEPRKEDTDKLIEFFSDLRTTYHGATSLSSVARSMLETIYIGWRPLEDVRFKSYNTRRFTQLLKLCLIVSAASFRKEVTEHDVIFANTILAAAERLMPKALGEFGKSKNSDVTNKVMDLLEGTTKPLTTKEIWMHVHKDLEQIKQLGEILMSLSHAEKIQHIKDRGYLPKKKAAEVPIFVDWELLTEEERRML